MLVDPLGGHGFLADERNASDLHRPPLRACPFSKRGLDLSQMRAPRMGLPGVAPGPRPYQGRALNCMNHSPRRNAVGGTCTHSRPFGTPGPQPGASARFRHDRVVVVGCVALLRGHRSTPRRAFGRPVTLAAAAPPRTCTESSRVWAGRVCCFPRGARSSGARGSHPISRVYKTREELSSSHAHCCRRWDLHPHAF